MTNDQFYDALYARAQRDQMEGYPVGHPSRENMEPIVAFMGSRDRINRAETLKLPCYWKIGEDERARMLQDGGGDDGDGDDGDGGDDGVAA